MRRLPGSVTLLGDEIVPHYVGASDYPWLTRLLDVISALQQRPRREVFARTRPEDVGAPGAKHGLVLEALRPFMGYSTAAALDPREVRLAVCLERAKCSKRREHVLEQVAARFEATRDVIEQALFADVASEQVLALPERLPSLPDLAALANLRLVRGVLAQCAQLRLHLLGNSRAVIRQARLRGLIVSVDSPGDGDAAAQPHGATLSVSGPLSLFRQTSLYGRALGELVPQLVWCERFTATARVPFAGRMMRFTIGERAPVFPAERPKPFDSDLERRFARDFTRAAPGWRAIREPAPVDVGGAMIFPDFELVSTANPSRRVLLEIVGFWTAEYLQKKLEQLRRAKLPNLILCIDERRACDGAALPPGVPVLRYAKNKIPCDVLLETMESLQRPATTANGGAA